jgi:hypothetical protein
MPITFVTKALEEIMKNNISFQGHVLETKACRSTTQATHSHGKGPSTIGGPYNGPAMVTKML